LVQKYFKGANQKSIVEEDLFKIKIPIPSLERQREIVAYCESNDSRIQQLEAEIEHNKELTQQFMTIVNTKEPTNEVVAVRSFTSKK
jgi:restriction endonuclease S subunit